MSADDVTGPVHKVKFGRNAKMKIWREEQDIVMEWDIYGSTHEFGYLALGGESARRLATALIAEADDEPESVKALRARH